MSAAAQSGRRPPKRRPEPPPAPAPAETAPAPAPAPEDQAPKTPISAAKYVSSMNIPYSVAGYVFDETMTRLRQFSTVEVLPGKDMNRKEAIDVAKESESTYVLWLDFSLDALDEQRAAYGSTALRNIVVQYVLYTPKTGKVKTQGRLYCDATRARIGNGQVLVPYGGIGGGAGGYSPEETGQRIAEYVLHSLDLQTSVPLPRPR